MSALTRIAYEWAIRCFGEKHVHNRKIRALRVAEEAVELAQACGVPADKIFDVVQVVYSRPVGGLSREIGGVLLTTAVLCASEHWDPNQIFLDELCRVLDKPTEHFTKRNQEKIDLGLTV